MGASRIAPDCPDGVDRPGMKLRSIPENRGKENEDARYVSCIRQPVPESTPSPPHESVRRTPAALRTLRPGHPGGRDDGHG